MTNQRYYPGNRFWWRDAIDVPTVTVVDGVIHHRESQLVEIVLTVVHEPVGIGGEMFSWWFTF